MRKLLFIAVLLFMGCNDSHSAEPSKGLPFGVNLAGAEFGQRYPGTYGTEYAYPTKEDIKYFANKGLKLIRVPFSWERIQLDPTKAELNTAEMKRLKEVLKWASELGVVVIVDMHNYCRRRDGGNERLIGDGTLTPMQLATCWRLIADQLKEFGNIYGYGIMNEPHDMLAHLSWRAIAQTCINEIRKTDTSTAIIVGGDSWSSAYYWEERSDNLKDLSDPSDNLIFEAHVYFDSDFSGTYRGSYDEEGGTELRGVQRVRPFVEWCKKNGVRGFVGEYGIPRDDPRWLTTLENMLAYLAEEGINGTYWAAGPIWGDYKLSVQPTLYHTQDRPQMAVLEKYKETIVP